MKSAFALLPGIGAAELLLISVILSGIGFWVWMVVDCAKNEKNSTQKTIWIILMILFWILGAVLYFLVRKLPRKPTTPPPLTSNVRPKNMKIAGFITLALVASASWLLLGGPGTERWRFYGFDRETWVTQTHEERYYSARYLIDNELLLGKNRGELFDMLGPPYSGSLQSIRYRLGMARGMLLAMDSDWLEVRFEGLPPKERVIGARIVSD